MQAKTILRQFLLYFILFIWGAHLAAQVDRYVDHSILNNGKWVRFQIKETGIYKITYSDLKKIGFPDPSKVSVYGYGGWPLEEDFRKPYIDDLPQASVWRGDDYLLFYGKGVIKWEYGTDEYNSKTERFIHTNNPYSEYGCYFLSDSIPPERTKTIESNTEAGIRITTFDDYRVHEIDKVSLNNSGRELYGESFYKPELEFTVSDIDGITGDKGLVEMRFVANCSSEQRVTLSIHDKLIFNARLPERGKDSYVKAKGINPIGEWDIDNSSPLKTKIHFSQANNSTAYLDYVRFQFKRELKAYDQPFLFFRSIESMGRASRFIIQNATQNTLVFDITDGIHMKLIDAKLNGSELSFFIPKEDNLREFVLVQLDKKFPSIDLRSAKEVANQNLHHTPQKDYIIIAPPAYVAEATRLGEAHRDKSELEYIVVTPEEIYNEFSSGTPDATAYRRFVKMFYDRSKSVGRPPKYLLLLGDGAYDNRFITPEWAGQKKNADRFLLTYQTKESLNSRSHVVDDYFGFLDDNEGANISSATLDIGIGRFPVSSPVKAKQCVDKVIHYMNNGHGIWKNNLCFVGDDGSEGDQYDTLHQENTEELTTIVEKNRPEYLINKYLFDAYRYDAGRSTYPEVIKWVHESLKNGAFLINYVGHGNTTSLSDEGIITQNDIMQAQYSHLPIWITATCDFCRFDASANSAGEEVFLNAKSGGIALITTSRVAYTTSNKTINKELINCLFDSNRDPSMALGDVVKNTKIKCSSIGITKLGFCLIGDPALKLAYPDHTIEIKEINGKQLEDDDFVTLRAMEKSSLSGVVLKPNGEIDEEFNGVMDITIFDNKDSFTTLGNRTVTIRNAAGEYETVTRYTNYEDYFGKLYVGKHRVENGRFTVDFTVASEVSYVAQNKGKICMYAYDEQRKTEASGGFTNFNTGTTSDHPVIDTTPPEIRSLYLNDSTFVDGARVNNTPYFFIKVWDENGINMTGSGIGHDITLRIGNKWYALNNYYEPSFDVEGEGYVRFSIPELEVGVYEAEFMIWDVLNNSSKATFTFEVVEGLKPNLYKIYASPSPARESVEFRLDHNRPDSRINVEIQVYDFAGKKLWMHKESGSSDLFKSYIVSWDLTSNAGTRLVPGVYLYRAAIHTKGSKEATQAEKLIILAQ